MWCRLTRNRFITDINFALRYFPLAVITEIDLAPYGNEDRFIPFDRLFLSTVFIFRQTVASFCFLFSFFFLLSVENFHQVFFLIMDSIVNIINNVTFCQVLFFFFMKQYFIKMMRCVSYTIFVFSFFFFCSFYNTPPRYSSGTEKNHFSYASSKMRISPDDEYARGAREVTQ